MTTRNGLDLDQLDADRTTAVAFDGAIPRGDDAANTLLERWTA